MEQITLADIDNFIRDLKRQGADLSKYPVYLGDDEELNGIHNGWCIQQVDKTSEEDKDFVEMIQENYANNDFDKYAILIS